MTLTLVLIWLGIAVVLFPIVAIVLTKMDLDIGQDSDTGETVGASAVVAALWPLGVTVGLFWLIFIWPTYTLVERTKAGHWKRQREAETEKEVLARIAAEQKAKDDAIKREIDGEPEPQPEPSPKRPEGRLRKSLNAQFFSDVARNEKRRVEKQYDPVPKDEIPSTIRKVTWL